MQEPLKNKRKKNSLIQSHVFSSNQSGFRRFIMVKRNKILRKKERNCYKSIKFTQKEGSC